MSSFEKQSQDKSLAMPDFDTSLAAAILGSDTVKEHILSLNFGHDDDQELALQSSSFTDLVEDRSFPEPLHVHDKSSFVCVLCKEKAVVSGGELSHNSLHPLYRQQPKQLSSKEQQLHKHPRSSLHRSVELQEAKVQEITHALLAACVYGLPDLAWRDPACVFSGHLSQSQFSAKKFGQKMTNKLSARHRTRSSKSQVETGTGSSALPTVVSVGLPASFRGASLVASSHRWSSMRCQVLLQSLNLLTKKA